MFPAQPAKQGWAVGRLLDPVCPHETCKRRAAPGLLGVAPGPFCLLGYPQVCLNHNSIAVMPGARHDM